LKLVGVIAKDFEMEAMFALNEVMGLSILSLDTRLVLPFPVRSSNKAVVHVSVVRVSRAPEAQVSLEATTEVVPSPVQGSITLLCSESCGNREKTRSIIAWGTQEGIARILVDVELFDIDLRVLHTLLGGTA